MVLNISGHGVSAGEERKGYVGAGPPPNTGLHRYVFVLYQHDHPIKAEGEAPLLSTQCVGRPPRLGGTVA
jgi:phosphatidylethanolamine-binding protein